MARKRNPNASFHGAQSATARDTIQQSQLSDAALSQRQGMGDIDLEKLTLSVKEKVGVDISDETADATIDRTIEGASTFTVSLVDDGYGILNSGRLTDRLDLDVDGLWFRLAQARMSDDARLDLVFEDREVAVLRTYNDKLGPISRAKITRAEFAQRLLDEPIELKIKSYIPELHDIQPVSKTSQLSAYAAGASATKQGVKKNSGGLTPASARHTDGEVGLTVKGAPASNTQIANANIALRVGVAAGASRKVLVCAIMTAIQESLLKNLSGGDRDSVGMFQQRKSQGWPASRDIAKDAAAFYSKAMGYDRLYPNLAYYALCQMVQNSANGNAYAQWRTEADRWVTEFGVAGGASETEIAPSSAGSSYFYYRGVPPTTKYATWQPEDSWDCLQRLASEVQWRCYCVAGTVFFVTEDYLFKTEPAASISYGTPGVIDISFDYDRAKRYATVTVTADIARWAAPPGSVVFFKKMGPVDGRFLVTQVSRSVFGTIGTITCKKPLPKLPEPAQPDLTGVALTLAVDTGQKFRTATSLVNPIPAGLGGVHGAVHETEGLPGFPALDFFAVPGTPVLAPENGRIVRLSGHDPLLGPVGSNGLPGGFAAAGGPLGWSVYLLGASGTTYFITHLGSRTVSAGASVTAGERIGTVADYDKWGRKSHVHIGVSGGSVDIETLGGAAQAGGQ